MSSHADSTSGLQSFPAIHAPHYSCPRADSRSDLGRWTLPRRPMRRYRGNLIR